MTDFLLLHMEENQGIRIRHLMTHASDSTNALFRVERLARAPKRFKVGFSSVHSKCVLTSFKESFHNQLAGGERESPAAHDSDT